MRLSRERRSRPRSRDRWRRVGGGEGAGDRRRSLRSLRRRSDRSRSALNHRDEAPMGRGVASRSGLLQRGGPRGLRESPRGYRTMVHGAKCLFRSKTVMAR
eukprot:13836154-Alexandrium_andersonii.AAC.1